MNAIALSVMVPNYNYGRFIGDTIQSVLAQAAPGDAIEIVVTDNASTDNSAAVVRGFVDPRVRLEINPCNVGFSANCERVASFARGRRMLLLSSDDRMAPGAGALAAYRKLEQALGPAADRAVWGSVVNHVDGDGKRIGEQHPDRKCWRDSEPDEVLSNVVGLPVRKLAADKLLRRSLELLRSPLPFLSTCYSRVVHDAAGGYSGGRLMNPDKWFLWKALGVADMAYYIDAPLFDYRVHGGGQGSIELKSGALKHLTDEYIATFNLPDFVLAKAGITRDQLAAAFIEQDIVLRGFLAVSQGRRTTAKRGISFGSAAYPDLVRTNPKVWALRALIACGPVGTEIARRLRDRVEKRWAERESQPAPRPPR